MNDKALIGKKARDFCDDLWQRGDFWNFETSPYEQARCARLLSILGERRYERALEIGCGAGYFTRLLAGVANQIVALDIAPAAIARAQKLGADLQQVEFRVGNAMEHDFRHDSPWDLVVCADTIYYLGWLYSFFDIAWLASELFAATRSGGRFLLANTMDEQYDKLLLPYIIRTYRDLFLNVGYRLESEEIFRGAKDGVDFEVLISLLVKPEHGAT
jgi:SAM-dependent methyltransferase